MSDEKAIETDIPIVDAHHHLWMGPHSEGLPTRYLLDEFLADADGNNVIATVYSDCRAMYRKDGPPELRSLGETEFCTGIAAMAESGAFGPTKVCAGIVGKADLFLGERVRDILEMHLRIAGSRFKGVRENFAWVPFPIFGMPPDPTKKHILSDPRFLKGAAELAKLGLSYDGGGFHYQLPEVVTFARALPQLSIVLNHNGTPMLIGPDAKPRDETFAVWKSHMRDLAKCTNVTVKIGGLGLAFYNQPTFRRVPRALSDELVPEWKPYIETCIEIFGADRCMFESNFPVDAATSSYTVLWNTFKKCVAGASNAEKTALFSGTAKRVYRLEGL